MSHTDAPLRSPSLETRLGCGRYHGAVAVRIRCLSFALKRELDAHEDTRKELAIQLARVPR